MSHDPKDETTSSKSDKVERDEQSEDQSEDQYDDWHEVSDEDTDEWCELSSDEYETDDDDLGEEFVENLVDLVTFAKRMSKGQMPIRRSRYEVCPCCGCDPCDCH